MTTTVPRPAAKVSLRGRLLRLAETVTTPLLPADYLDLVSPLRAGAALRGRIVAVRPETRDAATWSSGPAGAGAATYPGSTSASASTSTGSASGARTRSPRVTERRDGRVAITVKAIPDGKVSNHLVRRAAARHARPARPGRRATSCCRRPRPPGAPPHRGQRHHAGDGDAARPACDSPTSCWCTARPSPDDVIFAARTARRWPRGARAADRGAHRHRRHARHRPNSTNSCPTCAERETWACGPAGMLDAVEGHWATTASRAPAHRTVPPTRGLAGEGGTVTFTGAGETVDADGATPMLDAGESAGVLMPPGCRMGICFGCVRRCARAPSATCATAIITTAAPATACSSRPACPPRRAPATSNSDRRPDVTVIQKPSRQPDRPPERRATSRTSAGSWTRSATQVIADRGERDAALHPQGDHRPSASWSWAAARCCCSRSSRRPGCVGTAGLVGGEDHGQHGDRPQRPARPVGLDARPEDPLHHLGVGPRLPARPVEALAQRAAPHVHQRGRQGQRPRLRHHARRRGPDPGTRSTSASRCGT